MKEKDDNDINKNMKWKNLVSWMKKSNSGRDNRETNKIVAREELLEKNRQGKNWPHWHQRKNKAMETLTCDFQKLETSLWEKDVQEP